MSQIGHREEGELYYIFESTGEIYLQSDLVKLAIQLQEHEGRSRSVP